ncbi:MAG: T9SS type A sorting domain-containing protein, partial [Spirochaetes bacterium]|nr:T9SS type A sorting domain-containing protein [Spirochaetota bacterium]
KLPQLIYNSTNFNGYISRALMEADDGRVYAGGMYSGPTSAGCVFRSGYITNSQEITIKFLPLSVLKYISFTKAHTLNGGSIDYEFAYSLDQGNGWSDWLPFNDVTLQNIQCTKEGRDELKVRITLLSFSHDSTPKVNFISLQYDDGYRDSINDVVMAPNPFRPNKNNIQYVTFFNLPQQFELNVYSIAGGEVVSIKTFSLAGRYKWDVKNRNGSPLKNGVYICHLKDQKGNEKYLKLVVIR